jgi:uncharacterized membrane protein YgdD (TMEM256/DUF423 family)
MNNIFLKIGAILGAFSVAIGAFGAHAFKASLLASGKTETFETAVRYQFYGVFALIVIGLLSERYTNKWSKISGYLFLIGTLIFSGSLYLICLTGINLFGAVAPIGGSCLIAAWIFLFFAVKN